MVETSKPPEGDKTKERYQAERQKILESVSKRLGENETLKAVFAKVQPTVETVSQWLDKHESTKRLLSAGINASPGVSYLKLVDEGLRGKTWDGQDLTRVGQVAELSIAGSGALGWAGAILAGFTLPFSPESSAQIAAGAGTIYGLSWFTLGVMTAPDAILPILKKAGDILEENGNTHESRFVRTISNVVEPVVRGFEKSTKGWKSAFYKKEQNDG